MVQWSLAHWKERPHGGWAAFQHPPAHRKLSEESYHRHTWGSTQFSQRSDHLTPRSVGESNPVLTKAFRVTKVIAENKSHLTSTLVTPNPASWSPREPLHCSACQHPRGCHGTSKTPELNSAHPHSPSSRLKLVLCAASAPLQSWKPQEDTHACLITVSQSSGV